jgi:hypothetical protein
MLSEIGLQSDGPKERVGDDQLSVAPFVRRLVNPILSMPATESFVVAIFGPWGYGKSTALNFLEHELFSARMPEVRRAAVRDIRKALPAPIIVRFTPWLYGDVDTLLASFFETLAAELNEEISSPKKRKRLTNALHGIGEFVAPAAKVAVNLAIGPAGAVVDRAIEAVGGGIKGIARAMDGGEVTFAKRKQEAAKILVGLAAEPEPRRVVVLVDDLDRAAPPEILAMLKLVKLIADLPNITYIVALDKERVSSAVADTLKLKGAEDFLEKIVQVGVDLPPFGENQLAKMIVDGAQAIARAANMNPDVLAVEWSGWKMLLDQSYIGNIRRLVKTPRDVVRILNAYRFALLTARVQPEVHEVDLLLLCVLQVRCTQLFRALRNNRELLLGDELRGMLEKIIGRQGDPDVIRKARAERMVAMLVSAGVNVDAEARAFIEASSAERNIRKGVIAPEIEIVLELFPDCVEGRAVEHEQSRARRECRIASPAHFQGYFRLDPPAGLVRRADIESIYKQLLSDSFDGSRATATVEYVLKLSAEELESLERGLADMARAITPKDAMALLASLEVLSAARVSGDSTAGAQHDTGLRDDRGMSAPFDLLAALFLRAASVLRRVDDAEVRSRTMDATFAILGALPDDFGAELANDLTHRPPRSLDLTEEECATIAEHGLRLAEAVVRRRFSSAVDVRRDGRLFSHDLWRWRRLLDLSGQAEPTTTWPSIKALLDNLVEDDPLVVSEVVALAAGWGDGPSLSMHSPAETRATLLRVADPESVELTVRSVIKAGRWRETTWPHLLWEYIGEAPPF